MWHRLTDPGRSWTASATQSFVSVAVLIVGIYLIAQTFPSSEAAGLVLGIMLIGGFYFTIRASGTTSRWPNRLGMATAISLIPAGFGDLFDVAALAVPLDAGTFAISVATPWIILNHVLAADRVDNNIVFAAVSVYLMIGVLFGTIYVAVAGSHPVAFEGIDHRSASESLYYYSFVVLTTLGFGDVVPASGAMRALTVLETMVGQIFLIVLVARLVGMQVAQRPSDHRSSESERGDNQFSHTEAPKTDAGVR